MGTKKTSPLLFVFDAHREGGCGSVGTGPSGRSAAERGIAVGNGSGGIATAGRAGSAAVPGAWGRDGDAAGMGMPEGDSLRFRQGCAGANVAAGCLVAATEDVRGAGGAVRSGLGRGGRHNPARRRSVRIGTVRPGLQANEQAGAARRVQVCAAACVPLTGNRSLRNRRRGSGRTGTGSHSPL